MDNKQHCFPQTFFRVLGPIGPTRGRVVTLETRRREVPGSNPGRACRSSRSEFSVAFSETCKNSGRNPFESPLSWAYHAFRVGSWTHTQTPKPTAFKPAKERCLKKK